MENGCSYSIVIFFSVSEMKNNGRYTDLVTPVNFSSVQFSSFDVNEALGLFVSVLVAK